jgi:hypothetical protein
LYSKTDFSLSGFRECADTMKNVHNAVSDALESLRVAHRLREEIQTFDDTPDRTVVRLYCKSTQELRLEFEILEDAGDDHVICILQRNCLSLYSAGRFLDVLLGIL